MGDFWKRSMLEPKVLLDIDIIVSGLAFLSGNEQKVLKLDEDRGIALILPSSFWRRQGSFW
ncbi:MAG: hypothetical protein QW587_06240 [Candidatus Bathyarchaeia archaeon]